MTEPAATSSKNRSASGRKRIGPMWLVAAVILIVLLNRQTSVDTIDCTPEVIASKPDVVMLGAWWCTYCYQAKKYFQKNDIHYCEYDMENTPKGRQLYEENGGGAVPVLLIGDYVLRGFSRPQVEQALALLRSASSENKK